MEDRFQTAQEMLDAIDGKVKVEMVKHANDATKTKVPQIRVKRGNGFADVAGMTELKVQLQSDVIDLLQNPEQAKELGLRAMVAKVDQSESPRQSQ